MHARNSLPFNLGVVVRATYFPRPLFLKAITTFTESVLPMQRIKIVIHSIFKWAESPTPALELRLNQEDNTDKSILRGESRMIKKTRL